MSYLFLIIGFVLLIKGADFFVDGSSSLAKRFKIPEIIIGLTIVAMGTSAPEAAVSLSAALNKANGIVVGNVIGSNIFNLLVVVGVCAIIKPFAVKKEVLKSEFPLSIYATVLALVLCADSIIPGKENMLGRIDGIILLTCIVLFIWSQVRNALKAKSQENGESEIELLSPLKTAVYIIGGIGAVIWGGDLVVDSATQIAKSFGVSDHLIGLTIVAIGTSLPELVTSIVAAGKGASDLALGNVIGSNIFNIFFILGISSSVAPVAISNASLFDIAILIAISLISYLLTLHKKSSERWHGIIYVLLYILFMAYILVR
ncbi:MAG: calcium/sodium antiporter [Ruminococcaceae bacterium]|nr:calcium/sodium antiporter [Oscillospiraceae bacterium]